MIVLPTLPKSYMIPKVVHLIWVGDDLPGWAKIAWQRWHRDLPGGWDLRRWTNGTVEDHPFLRKVAAIADRYGQPPRGKANLLRLAIVSLYGGIYADTDSALVSPSMLDHLAGGHAPWLAGYAMNEHKLVLDNSCFGFPPGHPMLAEVFAKAQENLVRGINHTHFVSGPRVFRQVWEQQNPKPDVYWRWPEHNDPEVSRPFYEPSMDLPREPLERLSNGFPIVHISAMTPEERGYMALGGGQQVV